MSNEPLAPNLAIQFTSAQAIDYLTMLAQQEFNPDVRMKLQACIETLGAPAQESPSLRQMADYENLKHNVLRLLDMLAVEKRPCVKCGADLWFVVHPKTQNKMPLTAQALNHFADCPKAAHFKR